MKPFAVFVVAMAGDGMVAATTRASDRGEEGRIGLPGGKVDPGESPVVAAVRESAEEGWLITLDPYTTPAHVDVVDGQTVWWYRSPKPALMLAEFKEAGRIKPVAVPIEVIAASGYGNHWLEENQT